MGQQPSELTLKIGNYILEIPQSILVWFGLCIVFAIFCYVAGKKVEKADPTNVRSSAADSWTDRFVRCSRKGSTTMYRS